MRRFLLTGITFAMGVVTGILMVLAYIKGERDRG